LPKPALAAAIAAAIVAVTAVVALLPSDEGEAAVTPVADGAGTVPAPTRAAVRTLEIRGRREAVELGLRPPPRPLSAAARRNAAAARIALRYLGTPYSYGGASPAGFDCSGLVSYAYGRVGRTLPHNTHAIWEALPRVPRNRLRPGDMVFFNGLGHMGIYVGRGRYVHAPQSGETVEVEALASRDDYLGAVRA
jgi:cell wall-associated NlpC family hydrolase